MSPLPAPALPWGEAVRWQADELPGCHALPLGQVLSLMDAADERATVERMLALFRTTMDAGSAHAAEYVLQGGVLALRQVVLAAGAAPASGSGGGLHCHGDLADPAHDALVALARGGHADGVLGMRCGLPLPVAPEALSGGVGCGTERVSVLYSVAPDKAWALHLQPRQPATRFGDEALRALPACAFLVREVHRIVCPASLHVDERVNAAEVRLGVRAPSLSGRERQVCARIAGGHSASHIAAELGISASTVVTLRKRAYEKLGIHGRLDLRHLAA
jgi:DNA-binding CsgD family transcriptional regulator